MTDTGTDSSYNSHHHSRHSLNSLELLVSGAIAGAVAQTIPAPIDRVKILYQVNPNRAFSFRAALKTLVTITQNTGVNGLWRGNGAALVRVLPYASITFLSFEQYDRLLRLWGSPDAWTRFVAGAAAGCTGTIMTYPFDLVRARNAAHWNLKPRYQGYISPLREIVSNEGFFAIFSGMKATVYGIIPYTGIAFSVFETMKANIKKKNGYVSDREIPILSRLGSGALAGFSAQLFTYPLHVIRRRIQVQGAAQTPPQYPSVWSAFWKIYESEGVRRGLYKGFSLNLIKSPIAPAISFSVNDKMKQLFVSQREDQIRRGDHKLSPIYSLMSGGIAGGIAKTVIAPGDRVKILYQVNPSRPFTLRRAIRSGITIWQNTGVSGLWRGNGAQLLRVIPYASITYFSFDRYKRFLKSALPGDTARNFLAGSGATATATICTYPLDLLRARMAAHWHKLPKYTTYTEALFLIWKSEGPLSLYRGLSPTLLGVIPYGGLSFGMFETSKTYLSRKFGLKTEHDLPNSYRLILGGVSGLIAQSATYPLDIVRRRMQVDEQKRRSTWSVTVDIYQKEGLRNFFKGLSMNWIKGPIAVGISFTINDFLKKKLSD